MINKRRLGIAAAVATLVGGLLIACGSDDRPNAAGGGGGVGGVLTGQCNVEGATHICSQPFSGGDGIKHCFKGTQVCAGGFWGACIGDGQFTSFDPSKIESTAGMLGGGGGLSIRALSSPSADAGVCTADPCNPDCVAFAECAGTASTSSYERASNPTSAYGALSGGFRGNPAACTPGILNKCRHDFTCNGSNVCVENTVGDRSALCALPDFTMGMPCYDGTTWKVNVCNRGSLAANVGTLRVTAHKNSPGGSVTAACPPGPNGSFPTSPVPNGTASINLATNPLIPGACRSFSVAALFPTLTIDNDVFFVANSSFAGPVLPECNLCNNYTALDDDDDGRPASACVSAAVDGGASDSGCPVTAEAGAGGAVTTVSISNNGLPPGQANNLFQDRQFNGLQCERYGGPSSLDTGDHATGYNKSACQADTHCIAGESDWYLPNDKNCHQWLPGERWAPYECAGIDLTIGLGCTVAGKVVYPVCNRGNAPVPPNTPIRISTSSPAGAINGGSPRTNLGPPTSTAPAAACPAAQATDCTLNTGVTGLLPGACITFDTTDLSLCPAGWANGTKNVFVNSDYSVAECNFGYEKQGVVQNGITASDDVGIPGQLGCANNWSITSNGLPVCSGSTVSYTTTTYFQDYRAVCPSGTHPVWTLLTWDADVPRDSSGSSDLLFEAQTAPDVDGGVGTYAPAAPGVKLGDACDTTASNCPTPAKGDPALCQLSGPTTCGTGGPTPACCPKQVGTKLGGKPLSTNENLRLKITLTPTPNNKLTPALRRWDLAYNCTAAE